MRAGSTRRIGTPAQGANHKRGGNDYGQSPWDESCRSYVVDINMALSLEDGTRYTLTNRLNLGIRCRKGRYGSAPS